MKETSITGVLVNTETGKVEELTIPNTLEALKHTLKCKHVEAVTRCVGSKIVKHVQEMDGLPIIRICNHTGFNGQLFTVLLDADKHLKKDSKISCLMPDEPTARIFGNLFVVGNETEDDGGLKSLTHEEIDFILRRGVVHYGGSQILACIHV